MSIYKPCDIRGQVGTELKPELYRSWGETLGRQLEPESKFVVGGDVRDSTHEYLDALIEGLCQAGVDVVDLGILPTPMIYYAKRRLDAAACAIVTASHNPPDTNGLKWMIGDRPPTTEQVRLLKREAKTGSVQCSNRPTSTPRSLDVSFDYVARMQETYAEWRELRCRVVLDPRHGSWGAKARRYLQAVFPHCLFLAINDEPEPSFGGLSPDCSRPELLEELSEAVYHERAHLGIAFDGDGDRAAFVDDQGTPLTAEEATWVLLRSFGQELQGESFVHDVKFSDLIPRTAAKLGAEPVVQRSGHAFIRTLMLETDALFGAEISGHYFFRALSSGDDGLFAACQMIAHLAKCRESLAGLRRMCPRVFMTPDLRVSIRPELRQGVIEQVSSAWSQYPQTSVDGIRVSYPNGWALVRSSVTEPALTFRFEADGWPDLAELVRRFCTPLADVGNALWDQYNTAMGTDNDGCEL